MDIAVPPHTWYAGELVNVVSGERLPVPPTHWPDTPAGCEPVPPSVLPSGAAPGAAIVTPGGHFLWATWGAGDDQVVQSVGAWLFGRDEAGQSGELESEVIVRGHPGRVIPMGSMDGPWAIAWEEGGCRYEVQLTPGTTQDETVSYAERYGALAAARPILVPAVVAEREELPWCGHEIVVRQPEGDYFDAGVRACFLEAYDAGEPAEFVSDGLTVEGGRWRTIFRSTGGGEARRSVNPGPTPPASRSSGKTNAPSLSRLPATAEAIRPWRSSARSRTWWHSPSRGVRSRPQESRLPTRCGSASATSCSSATRGTR
jgi:hypothetical protein